MGVRAYKPSLWRHAGVGALLLVLALAGRNAAAADPVLSGAQIEAAFVYNFTKFVEWPARTFASKSQPLVIGVLGESALKTELKTIVEGRKVNGRPILVRSVATPEEAAAAHVLFVGEAEDEQFVALLPSLGNDAILTVGESAVFADAGGAFRFVQQDGKLRFEINMASVESRGLKVSGELQKLATAVRRSP